MIYFPWIWFLMKPPQPRAYAKREGQMTNIDALSSLVENL